MSKNLKIKSVQEKPLLLSHHFYHKNSVYFTEIKNGRTNLKINNFQL